MPMKKYTQSEGKLTVLRGAEAAVLSDHVVKTGKKVSDFSAEELKALDADLQAARGDSEEEDEEESEA